MRFSFLLVVLALIGCGGDDDGRDPVDSGPRDAGPPDAMPGEDGGPPDRDTGTIDIDGGRDSVDLRIRIHGLDPHDGRPLRLRVEDRSIVPLPAPVFFVEEIASGDVEILVPDGMPRDVFGVFAHFYVDGNADETCTDPEPAWQVFISNTFEEPEIVADVLIDDPSGAGPTTESCAAALTPM